MQIDQAGEDFIKSFEGLRLEPYQDEAGVWTIGWGHIEGVSRYTPSINLMQAQTIFDDDIEPIEEAVTKDLLIDVTQSEFNALVSFAFNEGTEALHNSTLLKKLNAGDRQGAAKQFDRWIYVKDEKTKQMVVDKGLVRRRLAEKELFLNDFNASRVEVAS